MAERYARSDEDKQRTADLVAIGDVKRYAEEIDSLPDPALGKAKSYLLNHWEEFTTYLEDGHIEMTHHISERAIKPFVIARKNFFLCDDLFSSTNSQSEFTGF